MRSSNRCTAADFSKNGIGTLGLTQLCEALRNNDMLRTLILGTNSIGDEGAETLAGYMASEHFVRIDAGPQFSFCQRNRAWNSGVTA